MLFYNYITNTFETTYLPTVPLGYCLVKNKSFGVNRADILQKMGKYPHINNNENTNDKINKIDILGLELAGEVCYINDIDINNLTNNPQKINIGSKIMAIVTDGAYADYVLVPLKHCINIPDNLTYNEAASLPEAIFTVWHALFNLGNLIKDIEYKGKTIYINAASSGVGTIAIQICLVLGFKVIASTSSSDKIDNLNTLFQNLSSTSNTKNTNLHLFCTKQISLTDFCKQQKLSFDICLDMLGNLNEITSCINYNGKIVSIAFLQGAKAEINIAILMQKQIQLSGTMLRLQPPEVKDLLTKQIIDEIIPYISIGKIKPIIYKNYNIKQIQQAHNELLNNQHIGKLVVNMST